MKKFLSKMWVMILLLVLAVGGLALYIGMLARPISYGMAYTYSDTVSVGVEETTMEMRLKFKNSSKVDMTIKSEGTESTMEMWYYREGRKIALLSHVSEMTEEQYNQEVENFKADKTLFENSAAEINAFRIKFDTEDSIMSDMKCNGAVVFAVVWGVVELALIAFGALSLVFFLKDRKDETVQASDTPVAE